MHPSRHEHRGAKRSAVIDKLLQISQYSLKYFNILLPVCHPLDRFLTFDLQEPALQLYKSANVPTAQNTRLDARNSWRLSPSQGPRMGTTQCLMSHIPTFPLNK